MTPTPLIAAWNMPQAVHLFWVIAWGGVVLALTISFFVLMLTKKGRANPLRICIVLSLLVHTLLAGYATTVQIVAASLGGDDEAIDIVVLSPNDATQSDQPEQELAPRPWERPVTDAVPPEPIDVARTAMSDVVAPRPATRNTLSPTQLPSAADLGEELAASIENSLPLSPAVAEDAVREALAATTPREQAIEAEQIESTDVADAEVANTVKPDVAAVERVETSDKSSITGPVGERKTSPLADAAAFVPQLAEAPTEETPESAVAGNADILSETSPLGPAPLASLDPTISPETTSENTQQAKATPATRTVEEIPEAYQQRLDPNRGQVARRSGGSPEAQSAVDSGLAFLARAQSADGRWDTDHWGGGQELNISGSNRHGAGGQADTGITGLTTLAFLGAGHTHQHGDYQATVARGLTFLMRAQRSDGNLAGDAKLYARMYCHGMASFALSEAYAITGDQRLLPAVQRAIDYIIVAQDKRGGGWRYQPGDAGDTSQLGWQVMALKSAELAGIEIPSHTRTGIERFLRSVSSGRQGGLASYQPRRPASVAMTAEALVCRQFIGYPATHAAVNEAADYLMTSLPSADRMNLYYYYYATLALHPLQDQRWTTWNAALQKTLIETQRRGGQSDQGNLTGSWDPDSAWGSHGGRVYTTAIATLSLEVYYRYASPRQRPTRAALRP